jgi:hypothetical protein
MEVPPDLKEISLWLLPFMFRSSWNSGRNGGKYDKDHIHPRGFMTIL